MKDPTFTSRIGLHLWAHRTARYARTNTARLRALDRIKRVTLAHAYLITVKRDD